jgi:hypothetical protein
MLYLNQWPNPSSTWRRRHFLNSWKKTKTSDDIEAVFQQSWQYSVWEINMIQS